MRLARRWALAFSVLLGLGLAVSVPWLLAIWTDDASSDGKIAVVVILAVLTAAAFSIALLLLYHLATVRIPGLLRRIMVWVTFRTVREAIAHYAVPIQPSGIGIEEGRLVIRLACGTRDRIGHRQRFLVINDANRELWGVLEAHRVDGDTCLCLVSDRINAEFWEYLEQRINREPSLPAGITVTREVPDEEEFGGWLRTVLDLWRSHQR